MKNIDKKAVGGRISLIRLKLGDNATNFGKKFGTSGSIVARWENGTQLPNTLRLKNISQYGNVTINELLYGSTEEQEHKKYKDFFEFVKEMALSGELDRDRILEKIKKMEEVKDVTKI